MFRKDRQKIVFLSHFSERSARCFDARNSKVKYEIENIQRNTPSRGKRTEVLIKIPRKCAMIKTRETKYIFLCIVICTSIQ